jgi:hypothetical protein
MVSIAGRLLALQPSMFRGADPSAKSAVRAGLELVWSWSGAGLEPVWSWSGAVWSPTALLFR